MQTTRIVIIGAGLSGLYAAHLLERQGIHDYRLLEARDRLGGRIASMDADGQDTAHPARSQPTAEGFDLGSTWFWPDHQPALGALVAALGLRRFEQPEAGDIMLERSPKTPATRMRGNVSAPPSVRLVGGMGALIEALRRTLDPAKRTLDRRVSLLRKREHTIEVHSQDRVGRLTMRQATHVLLALPPRLLENSIAFDPPLPTELARQWRATATWMAPHAKYLAIYPSPFWRDQGLSGAARSALGPLGDIHDASMPDGRAALFGFLGVPARVRSQISDEVLRAHCRQQLSRLFGPRAATPQTDVIKDWARDPYTATAADIESATSHAQTPRANAASGPWHGCLTGIASEWSPQFPGYLAGAIQAAELGVQQLVSRSLHPDH